MPRQNRVTPFSDFEASPARGLFMSNRGILHDTRALIVPLAGGTRIGSSAFFRSRSARQRSIRPVITPNCSFAMRSQSSRQVIALVPIAVAQIFCGTWWHGSRLMAFNACPRLARPTRLCTKPVLLSKWGGCLGQKTAKARCSKVLRKVGEKAPEQYGDWVCLE